jgi:CRISPR system Cascade subunit CasD
MDYLIFRLQAPLSSWGESAVGEYRPTASWPGESALLGLLGAALGIKREDAAGQESLRDGVCFAVGVLSSGDLIRDYHTAQVPGRVELKGRPHRTRRDELSMPKEGLNTILSSRDYRQNGDWLVAVRITPMALWSLVQVSDALLRPKYVLYLGRKSCPLGMPLAPKIVQADSAKAALDMYRAQMPAPRPMERLVWGNDIESGVAPDLTVPRKDRLIARNGWQFGDRLEHSALLEE